MFASKTTRGFYDAAIHGDNMPADVGKFSAGATTLSGGTVYANSSCNWFAIGY